MPRNIPSQLRVERLRLLAKLVVLFCCKAALLVVMLQLSAEGNLKSAEAEIVELCRICDGQPSLAGNRRTASRIPLYITQPAPSASQRTFSQPANLGCFLTPDARLPLRL